MLVSVVVTGSAVTVIGRRAISVIDVDTVVNTLVVVVVGVRVDVRTVLMRVVVDVTVLVEMWRSDVQKEEAPCSLRNAEIAMFA